MAKNLIDDSTFEFVEGAEKADQDTLAQRMSTAEGIITNLYDETSNLSQELETAKEDISDNQTEIISLESSLRTVSGTVNTHVSDDTKHLTASEKQYLSEPYVAGSYTGTGNTTGRTINLGFTPLLVIVYGGGMAVSMYLGISSNVLGQVISTKGIEIIQNGFQVEQDASAQKYLNEAGITYTYMAFRKLS